MANVREAVIDVMVDDIMSGGKINIDSITLLNELVTVLEKKNHKGIVFTGSNPWLISVVL